MLERLRKSSSGLENGKRADLPNLLEFRSQLLSGSGIIIVHVCSGERQIICPIAIHEFKYFVLRGIRRRQSRFTAKPGLDVRIRNQYAGIVNHFRGKCASIPTQRQKFGSRFRAVLEDAKVLVRYRSANRDDGERSLAGQAKASQIIAQRQQHP